VTLKERGKTSKVTVKRNKSPDTESDVTFSLLGITVLTSCMMASCCSDCSAARYRDSRPISETGSLLGVFKWQNIHDNWQHILREHPETQNNITVLGAKLLSFNMSI